MRELLEKHLLKEEGERLEPYKDSEGYWTIGVGHLIDNRKGGSLPDYVKSFPITRAASQMMFGDDLLDLISDFSEALPWAERLDDVRQVVLLSMAFQMGVGGLLKFRKTLKAVREANYYLASNEMLDSRWARQTPRRAIRLAIAMQSGKEDTLV